MTFSDRTMALLRSEFTEFDFVRADDDALGDASPECASHLVVCEEGMAATAQRLLARGHGHVALAFDDARSVIARLEGLGITSIPAGLSLVPMNVRLDAWLSIMQLLLCGESYVPVSVQCGMGGSDGRGTAAPWGRPRSDAAPPAANSDGRDEIAMRTLTDRERRVLPLIAQGRQNKVIANELNISEHTVKLHVHHIIGKLGVRNRTEAAGFYLAQSSLARIV